MAIRAVFGIVCLAMATMAPAGIALALENEAAMLAASQELRARAIITALSSGDAATYELVAREHYSDALFARRTPAERAAFVAQMAQDFSPMQIVSVTESAGALVVRVNGNGSVSGVLTFRFEDTPEQKIARIEIEAEAGGDHGGPEDGPQLPPPPIAPAQSAADMGVAIDRWIEPLLQHDDFAGVVLIARDGRPYVTRAYGSANRALNIPAAEDTVYNVASIGKTITQTAIARLIQDGRITFATTVGEILPDYPNVDARSATIEQLLTMRGGISDFFGDDFQTQPKSRFNSNRAYYQYVSHLPQRFPPGARNEYCNGCYVVLGEMVQRVSGMRYEDFVQLHVLTPAGMTRTAFLNAERLPRNAALPYVRSDGPGSPYVDSLDLHGAAGSGAGGIYSNALDLLAFDNALREGRLLNAEMSAWVLGGAPSSGRNSTSLAIAGGAPGTSAVLESDGHWTVIVTGNVHEPLPERIGVALARQLSR